MTVRADWHFIRHKPKKTRRKLGSHFASFYTDLFDLKGTALVSSLPQLTMAVGLSWVANWAHNEYKYRTNPVILQLVGGMLAFFIVFRTNLAYDRYYEGKKLLGSLNKGLCDVMTSVVSSAPKVRGRFTPSPPLLFCSLVFN